MSNAPAFRRLIRSESTGRTNDALHDAYRAGKVTIRYTAERGLEHIGAAADAINEEQRLRRLRGR
jgi:hypothetical protein